MITQLLRFVNPSISVMVCGHLGREELDAASLANCIINILGLSIDTGFSTACDTLFSQAYGSHYRKVMGIFLQRALCVVCFIYTILACIHLNIEAVLLLLGQDPLIASSRSFSLISAFSNWGVFFRLGIPGIFMVALEEWCFEIMTLIAGTLGAVTLGAQAIVFQIQSLIYMIPLGLFTAVNIRVGQKLGAFDPVGARNVYLTALTIVSVVAICTGLPVILLRKYIPHMFTSDENICLLASKLMPMLLIFQFYEGFAGVSEAVLLACGRQILGAITIFCGYYCIGMPIAMILTYKTSLGILGSWIGLAIGFGLTTSMYTIFALRTDWVEQARQARRNITESQGEDLLKYPLDEFGYRSSVVENHDDSTIFHQLNATSISSENLLQYQRTTPNLTNKRNSNVKHLVLKIFLFSLLFTLFSVLLYLRFRRSPPLWYTHCKQQIDPVNVSTFCIRMMPWDTSKQRDISEMNLGLPIGVNYTFDTTIVH
ncbi:unnamed protein product [Heterobilharzia americana]|nr:unnamed protein product [Heterobilharzia americana]